MKVEISAVKGSMVVISSGASFFQVRVSKLRRPLGTLDLEQPPDSRERTGAPVLWLSCEGQIDVWVMFSDNSYLSAILDRQGLLVAAAVVFRKKRVLKASHHSSCKAFGQSSWKRILRSFLMSPTVTSKEI